MSHSKERSEKNCLNCNETVLGRYCQRCGQENIEPKETTWGLISHFFQDITHFDGKFFSTGKLLFTRPGFLPKEYISGRRASYLHPIRMYVFTSAVFFLTFYSIFGVNNWGVFRKDKKSWIDTDQAKKEALKAVKTKQDSISVENAFRGLDSMPVDLDEILHSPASDSTEKPDRDRRRRNRGEDFNVFNVQQMFEDAYSSNAEYDSIQAALPADERDGWWNRQVEYRNIKLKQKYGEESSEMYKDLADKFLHTFPYLLFISLPLYALFLKLLYVRRKQFYYVDHGLFLIYLYIFTFLWLLIFFGIQKMDDIAPFWAWNVLAFAMMIWGIYYAYKSMRKFYMQGRGKTILKYLLFNLMTGTAIIFLFLIFFLIALMRL